MLSQDERRKHELASREVPTALADAARSGTTKKVSKGRIRRSGSGDVHVDGDERSASGTQETQEAQEAQEAEALEAILIVR